MALGPKGGGAIKLTPDEDVSFCLGVGEGIETTLSMRAIPAFGGSPIWSLLDAGNISALPVLPGIEHLWIAVDHDANGIGLKASRACAKRWSAAGRSVTLIKPKKVSTDLNDLIEKWREQNV